ncbi:hypothetical protein QO002_004593 [Pararhizobium capsulatum DSM 1112]|uniref:Uncharacterized protein n=1 Tax=Pararhizobium capsulatum DSM 1112 TaxID=1121113 RepID=A0ABU0BZW8_9HYPH|nr:hypothetical protein [Pararhizobium capsulatum]MDQ0322387.1 hypothetical protein [Pararhizobium capsulatum DSM 1112]
MSEVQNKAVRLLVQTEGTRSTSLELRRDAYLASALDLYYASGGSVDSAKALLGLREDEPPSHVDVAVANVVVEVAGLSHIHDIDMIQATYNRLDAELHDAEG